MFRRLSTSLPKDPQIPADLTKLGYFINDHDQIRQIEHPEKKYQFNVNRNERVNEVHKEAVNSCIRSLVLDRLHQQGLDTVRLPLGSADHEKHVPILVSKNLSQKTRVILLFGERHLDLGILSYRVLGDAGIKVGSAIDLVNAIMQMPETVPGERLGIIITNPGQLLWYRGGNRAISYTEWMHLPRKSAVHESFAIDQVKNTVPGNVDYEQHVRYIFEHVVSKMVSPIAKLDLIGLEYTGCAAMMYLASNWDEWSGRIAGICLGGPQHSVDDLESESSTSPSFTDFVGKRCRAYFVSPSPVETLLTGRTDFGCNCYASGEELYGENIVIAAWRSMLDWLNLIHASPGYEEIAPQVDEEVIGNGHDKGDEE